ncbi:D-aminoacyl-tRNA deacylase [Gudongella sp. SC589]|jgi:D-tyrosyl-tRNA(Tyr) deacylase|uniref:D-aminoacyl-tRNA deacylase n=1 Tax=Gudongella sp. SC589 TaxID=3385990 RepID=UPI0039049398
MRAVVQRVSSGKVIVNDEIVGEIEKGLLVYLGVGENDTETDLEYMVNKVTGLRIFEDENEKMNLSVQDIGGEILAISQFTLYGDARKGKRPSFTDAASPDVGDRLYERFIERTTEMGIRTESGVFGAHMMVDYVNDGPVTILLDSNKLF